MGRIKRGVAVLAFVAASLIAACGGSGTKPSEKATSTPAAPAAGAGIEQGKRLFVAQGCGSCHTFAAAGSTGTAGPDLDERLKPDASKHRKPLAAFVRESIVDPNAFVAPGFTPNIMPGKFGQALSDRELGDLVAFLTRR